MCCSVYIVEHDETSGNEQDILQGSMLQHVAVCCSVLQRVAACSSENDGSVLQKSMMQYG